MKGSLKKEIIGKIMLVKLTEGQFFMILFFVMFVFLLGIILLFQKVNTKKLEDLRTFMHQTEKLSEIMLKLNDDLYELKAKKENGTFNSNEESLKILEEFLKRYKAFYKEVRSIPDQKEITFKKLKQITEE